MDLVSGQRSISRGSGLTNEWEPRDYTAHLLVAKGRNTSLIVVLIVWALLVAFLLIWIVSALLVNGEYICLDRRPVWGLRRTRRFTPAVPGT